MTPLDYAVLIGYFVLMAVIGVICMFRIKAQEDYFMGGRAFGKLLQTFAAFGAGTGSNDPVTVGRTTWTSGLSGIWGVLMWLFVTPFYWIFGVWYRRMRHLTIGDWFTERYESKSLGAAYCVFGIAFYMMYFSSMFTAITKVAAPLFGFETVNVPGIANPVELQYVLVPAIAAFVVLYGVLGGLKAAYWTDLVQGLGIIALSVILIPYGLLALAHKFDPDGAQTLMRGFEVMHQRLPESYFKIFQGPRAGEFPLHYILSLTILGLVGIVVQPHFISTGGGSAKTENSARVGLVAGNFLKRFCTVGWALTGLIVLTLMADSTEIARDPDVAWGVAAREVLGPMNLGLVGLMLACLLAALMSSADCYMIMVAGLVTRNVYAPIRPRGSEKEYLFIGRISGLIMVVGAAWLSLKFQDVFKQFVLALQLPIVFAAAFWLGMWWRRANKWSAWLTVLFALAVFFIIPLIPQQLPQYTPAFMNDSRFAISSYIVTTTITRPATEVDVARHDGWVKARSEADAITDEKRRDEAIKALGAEPASAEVGQPIQETFKTGGKPIFWSKLEPVGDVQLVEVDRKEDGDRLVVRQKKVGQFKGSGTFALDFVLYQIVGMDLESKSNAMLKTMELPPKLITPFVVLILLSFITPRNRKEALDRYYTKMKVPVLADHEADLKQLEEAYTRPQEFEHMKLLPGSSLEIQKPTFTDVAGFVLAFAICFGIVYLAVWVMNIGG